MASLNPFFENLVDSGASVKADCQFHLYVSNIHTNSLSVNRLAQYFCKFLVRLGAFLVCFQPNENIFIHNCFIFLV